jgi:hypothetical protein
MKSMPDANTFQTTLLGFDVRVPRGSPDPAWTVERRGRYLLDPSIGRPLSADPAVWPRAILTAGEGAASPDGPLDLWLELDRLRAVSPTGAAPRGDVVALGITYACGDVAAPAWLARSAPPCTPAAPELGWPCLGFDVADGGLTSGLMNCGFLETMDDVASLRRRFAPCLNASGLFRRFGDADAFRALSDARVLEHAPFFVFGLWLPLGEIEGR